jgi:hypothetical protein
MDFLTNKENTDTGIRPKIKTIRYDTNTCLVSVAPLPQGYIDRTSHTHKQGMTGLHDYKSIHAGAAGAARRISPA